MSLIGQDNMTKVSVIIPTYNRRGYIKHAIDSVLAQTYDDFEIIVVDDGSTDGTGEELKKNYDQKIKYIWQENQGESVARNYGVTLARGDYIGFLDSDDIWLKNKLDKQVRILDSNHKIGLVIGQGYTLDEYGHSNEYQILGRDIVDEDLQINLLILRNPIIFSTSMIRKADFNELGGFKHDIRYGEDWDFWLRLLFRSKAYYINEPLIYVRIHSSTQSQIPQKDTIDDILEDHLKIIRGIKPEKNKISEYEITRAKAKEYLFASLSNIYIGNQERAQKFAEESVRIFPQIFRYDTIFSNIIFHYSNMYLCESCENPSWVLEFARDAIKLRSDINLNERFNNPLLISKVHLLLGEWGLMNRKKLFSLINICRAFLIYPNLIFENKYYSKFFLSPSDNRKEYKF